MTASINSLVDLYGKYGDREYIGEDVTQMQHASQAAENAIRDGASVETVIGALLHDVGHLVAMERGTEEMMTDGISLGSVHHDKLGAEYLEQLRFPPEVTDFARHHVNAKRYLVFKDSTYHDSLSTASKMTLVHQGGPMSDAEAQAFENIPHYRSIIKMRTWDENAKVGSVPAKNIEKYVPVIKTVLRVL